MVDFSKLQKISNIARELMKHGQASSMEEAMRIASEQVEGGNVPQYIETKAPESPAPETTMTMEKFGQEKPAETLTQAPTVQVEQAVAPSDADLQRMTHIINQQQSTIAKLSTVVNTHTNQLNEVAGLKTKFNQLLSELTGLKEEIEKIKKSPMAPAPNDKGQTTFKQKTTPTPEEKPAPPPQNQGTGHVRSGNYKSDDVSIEKFFYFGGK